MKRILIVCLVATLAHCLHHSVCAQDNGAARKTDKQHRTDFRIAALPNPPIRISLASPVTNHIGFASLPAIRYAISSTNRYENLLIGTSWLVAGKEDTKTVQEMTVSCFVPTVAKKAEDELWTKTWRMFTESALQDSVSGRGSIRIALFAAIPDGSGDRSGFTYGRQLSNSIEVPMEIVRLFPVFRRQ